VTVVVVVVVVNYYHHHHLHCRSQWSHSLRRRSSAARLLRLWVRIPLRIWMSVCCVLSGRGLCDELPTRQEESYRVWCVVECDLETSWKRKPWPIGGNVSPKTSKPSSLYSLFHIKHKILITWHCLSPAYAPNQSRPACSVIIWKSHTRIHHAITWTHKHPSKGRQFIIPFCVMIHNINTISNTTINRRFWGISNLQLNNTDYIISRSRGWIYFIDVCN